LWPVRLPPPDGKILEWHRTAQQAAELAMDRWVRVVPNMSQKAYDIFESQGIIPNPEWPAQSFSELLRIAFRDHYVGDLDHPLIKRLHGYA
jgi:hypothetical protein